jgi:hypothetical protein|tara:strand:+ start:143 stop:364 length:222 start_codon:yes stop_codon:yes gene_type:complete
MKKNKDIQELLDAKQNAHSYCCHQLQGVVGNIQKLRKNLKKLKSKRWNPYSFDNELIYNQVLLIEIIKHLEKK